MNKIALYKICGATKTTSTGKLIYLILDDLADEYGKVVISQKTISNVLKVSRGTVSRNLHQLAKVGAIRISPTFHYDGGRAANTYIVL